MAKRFDLGPVCFITSPSVANKSFLPDDLKIISTILGSGIRWMQYREKGRAKKEIFYMALKLREITTKFGASLIVNDYADIALAANADGLHLGQDDLPLTEARKIMGEKIIGISTHSIEEAIEAEAKGADYIGFGPVFHTTTKDAGKPKGVSMLREVRDSVKIPVIAIGGIKIDNVQSVFESGRCSGVAISSGLLSGDIRENAEKFLSLVFSFTKPLF
ncbi:thiamine phosphate synthase [Thermodesulfovibrionales bacterium]|nr:thiamine phosphate synthase [Thermodesulfovibrionales bacterium]